MVRKLYKHEFLALLKWIIPLNMLCLVLAILSRLNMEFTGSDANDVIAGIMAFAFALSAFALITLSFVIVVSRFYKNLLSHEGYLTFTVPVSSATHIICKLLCGTVVMIISFAILGLSVGVISSDFIVSVERANVAEIFESFFGFDVQEIPTYRFVVLAVSYGILAVFSLMHGLLFTYAAMALGQRSKKNRVASAVGWYFIISTVRNIITNIINGFLTTGSESYYEETVYDISESTMMFIDGLQFSATFEIIETVFWGAIFFGITYHILTHKLNLE